MPGMTATIRMLNKALCDIDAFDPVALREALADEELTIRTAAEGLGAIDALPSDRRADMQAFLDNVPPACAAAVFAAVRSALARNLPVQVTWQPATAFEVRIWDISDDDQGMVNVFVCSPDPG
jgi:hypothetical protein